MVDNFNIINMKIENLIPNYLDENGYDVMEILSIKNNRTYYDVSFMDGEYGIVSQSINIKDMENWIENI